MSKSRNESYKLVRYNAAKHGILSRHVVLPHEDGAEFDGLLASLITEHTPSGPTEMHLVEEIASIIWRKRRVLQAEYTDVNKSLARAARKANVVLDAAVPFQKDLWESGEDLGMIIDMSQNEAQEFATEAMAEIQQLQQVMRILEDDSEQGFKMAIKALSPGWQLAWRDYLAESGVAENTEELVYFIDYKATPALIRTYRSSQYHQAVTAQAHGEGLQADRLEKLVRYESHLDRKLERILAMLLKLKDLGSTAPS